MSKRIKPTQAGLSKVISHLKSSMSKDPTSKKRRAYYKRPQNIDENTNNITMLCDSDTTNEKLATPTTILNNKTGTIFPNKDFERKSAVPEVDSLFAFDNPLIELAKTIDMSIDPAKVSAGDFSELTDLFVKAAFFTNAAMIHQLPQLFGRSVRLTHFIRLLEDNLFDEENFQRLTPNQQILLLRWVHMAHEGVTKSVARNSGTIISGMGVLPKLSSFSEELKKKKLMEIPEEERVSAQGILRAMKDVITKKAKERLQKN